MTKKIVFLIRNVAPEKFGGAEVYQLKLAEKLGGVGFCPVILTNSEELLKRAKKMGIQTLMPPYCKRQNWSGVWNLGLPFYFLYQLRLERWYKKIFREYKPEVVNIQSRDDWLAATQAAKKCKIRTLWTDHADFKNWALNNVNVKFKNLIGKKIIELSKYADKVIFISRNIEKETAKLIAPKKIQHGIVIENGVEDRIENYEDIVTKKGTILYSGRVIKEKGISELVAAFKLVKKTQKVAQLNIYGIGDKREIDRLIDGDERITYHGDAKDPIKVLAENEIFVLPSYMEGLSLALIEAAMMKKIIIATDVGGNPEVVIDGETGLLVPAKNVEVLAEKIEYLLDNPKSAGKMAENARKLYEEKFNFDKIFAEKMLPLYNRAKEKK